MDSSNLHVGKSHEFFELNDMVSSLEPYIFLSALASLSRMPSWHFFLFLAFSVPQTTIKLQRTAHKSGTYYADLLVTRYSWCGA